jgi:hypothetical protein
MPFQKQVVAADVMVMPRSLLLLHPVHDGGALMDLADLVGDAGVEEDALGRGRLAGIDVGHDAEVAIALEWGGAGHLDLPEPSCVRRTGPPLAAP